MNLYELINDDITNDNKLINTYFYFDKEKKGFITIKQFYRFISRTIKIWQPLYDFRMKLIKKIFPKDYYMRILSRKKHVSDILDFCLKHNNKFPKDSFCDTIINYLRGWPDKYYFDYEDSSGLIKLSYLMETFIHNYNQRYREEIVDFNNRYYKLEYPDELIRNIDSYFFDKSDVTKTSLFSTPSDYTKQSSVVIPKILKTSQYSKTPACNTNTSEISNNL